MQNRKANILFITVLILISLAYNYQEILFSPPAGKHVWRQADCLSITLNFYKENLSFFAPKIHWTGPGGDHHVLSEFPLVYFTVAKLWGLFGQKTFLFRLLNILIVFSGLFSLFRLSRKRLDDTFWAMYIPLFLFTSPLLVYYTNNFLADAPALGMALLAAWFYLRWTETQKGKYLLLAALFVTLAGLLKISALILFTALLIMQSVLFLQKVARKQSFSVVQKKELLLLWIVPLIVASWYLYARYFTNQHVSGVFLQSIYPIWDLEPGQYKAIFHSLYWDLLPSFFHKKALAALAVLFFLNLLFFFKIHRKWTVLLLLSFGGVILFMLLWFQAFTVHDYYLTNLLFLVPFILLLFLMNIKVRFDFLFRNPYIKMGAAAALLLMVFQTSLINRLQYNAEDPWLSANLFIKKEVIDYKIRVQQEHRDTKEALETITPFLREMGI